MKKKTIILVKNYVYGSQEFVRGAIPSNLPLRFKGKDFKKSAC